MIGQGIKGQSLHRITVRVFEQTLELVRPDDDRLIGTGRGKLLSISGTGDTVHHVLVSFKGFQQGSCVGLVDENPLCRCHNQVATIGIEADRVDTEERDERMISRKDDECYCAPDKCFIA